MWSRRKESPLVALCILLVFTICFTPVEVAAPSFIDGLKDGPYVERIVYKILPGDDQQVTALLSNEIDLVGDFIDPTFASTLESASDIELETTLRNGYGTIVINTAKNPFNYTAFRRACAFAINKTRWCDYNYDNWALPQDSLVPSVNPFSIEGQLDYSYYDADIETANQLLDDAGFTIDPITGFRLDPHGNPFSVILETAACPCITMTIAEVAAEDLRAVHINATGIPTDFYDYIDRLYHHGDYDMVFIGQSFYNFSLDWMAYDYWSEYADTPFYNFPNWQNSTYDSWRDQLLHATSYDDVYEAAAEMQKIWTYESPCIIVYKNLQLTAHRTDTFEGFVNEATKGFSSWWTNYRTRHIEGIDGPFGGTLRWSTPLDLDSFNIMISTSAYAKNVLQMLYDGLFKLDPEGNLIPWLVESYTVKTHSDDPAVSENHTRFTFDILRNATWTDGTPLTAEDIAFSLNYYRTIPDHPYSNDLLEMSAAYAPTAFRLIVEFSSESYWHIDKFALKPVIPMHKLTGVIWDEWEPSPWEAEMVTSGPFNVSQYSAGDYIELSMNPNYHYKPTYYTTITTQASTTTSSITETSTQTTSTSSSNTHSTSSTASTTPTTSSPTPAPNNWAAFLEGAGTVLTIGSMIVIVVFGSLIFMSRRK